MFHSKDIPCVCIGSVHTPSTCTSSSDIIVKVDGSLVYTSTVPLVRDLWESTSFELEKLQCNVDCVQQEREYLLRNQIMKYHCSFSLYKHNPNANSSTIKHKVGIIRQEGSNGDREMHTAFHLAGFETWDINMVDLLTPNLVDLSQFRGLVFVGGFSYADVNDSAKGWAASIRFNPTLFAQFEAHRCRSDTFALGICNGCQLMALLGYVPFPSPESQARPSNSGSNSTGSSSSSKKETEHPRFIHNVSGRFESRWCALQIQPSSSIFLQGMEGSTLGVWVAHGEGKVHFPIEGDLDLVCEDGLAPLRYVNTDNQPTEQYPCNPNGSPKGIAALSSPNGRYLAMMPHPERCVYDWQSPYPSPGSSEGMAPWLQMFNNAYTFCENVPSVI
jgi:phosphoribosylformylglycinamidine synthase